MLSKVRLSARPNISTFWEGFDSFGTMKMYDTTVIWTTRTDVSKTLWNISSLYTKRQSYITLASQRFDSRKKHPQKYKTPQRIQKAIIVVTLSLVPLQVKCLQVLPTEWLARGYILCKQQQEGNDSDDGGNYLSWGGVTDDNSENGKNNAKKLFPIIKTVFNSLKSFNRIIINSFLNSHGNCVQSNIFVFMSKPTIISQICNKE